VEQGQARFRCLKGGFHGAENPKWCDEYAQLKVLAIYTFVFYLTWSMTDELVVRYSLQTSAESQQLRIIDELEVAMKRLENFLSVGVQVRFDLIFCNFSFKEMLAIPSQTWK
jgi:hypothetical protein